MKNTLFLLFLFSLSTLFGQTKFDYKLANDVDVKRQGLTLSDPWGGGITSAQYSTIDLNMDGIDDLFVFDRVENSIKTYINGGTAGVTDYTYDPTYANKFPTDLQSFALLRDFNCDGKEDIFTSTAAGMKVYKNISNQVDGLMFELYTPLLLAQIGSNLTNLYVASTGLPVIHDIDKDGDIDVVAFDNFFPYAYMFENITTDCDTMMFKRKSSCWGGFQVNSFSDSIDLGVSCKGNGGGRHAGAYAMAVFEMNADNAYELFMGDSEFPNLRMLSNNGDQWNANFYQVDYTFPSNGTSVNLPLNPSAYFIDIDNDSVKDMLVSSNAFMMGADRNNVWLYNNGGANNQPNFSYTRNNFMVKDMVELGTGAYPRFIDVNGDGKQDLLVGNYGYFDPSDSTFTSGLAYFLNTGTASEPEYTLINDDFGGLSSMGWVALCPTFSDLDGDGDLDMLVGNGAGEIHHFENTAGAGNTVSFSYIGQYFGIAVSGLATPYLHDVTDDSLVDIVTGSQDGNLRVYVNTGTASAPAFSSTNFVDNWGGLLFGGGGTYYGYSAPALGYADTTGRLNLLVGQRGGNVYVYDYVMNNLFGSFLPLDTIEIRSHRTVPDIANINGSDSLELIVGEWGGGMALYSMTTADTTTPPDTSLPASNVTFTLELPDSLVAIVESSPDSGGVWVYGDFTSSLWDTGAIQLTQLNDSMWTTQQLVSSGPDVRFKFSIGKPGTSFEMVESGNFVSMGCGVLSQPGPGSDRYLQRSVNDTAVVYCWNQCDSACVYDPGTPDGFDEKSLESVWRMYPNPADDRLVLTFSSDEPKQLSVISADGRIVIRDVVAGPIHQLDLSGFVKGMYLVRVETGNYAGTEKLIVK